MEAVALASSDTPIKLSYDYDEPVVKRGGIWLADMSYSVGSEQSGVRYVLIMSNDIGNKYSPTVKVCCITSQTKTRIPTHVRLPIGVVPKDSIIMTEQVRTIDKMRLIAYKGNIDKETMRKVENALMISFGLKI